MKKLKLPSIRKIIVNHGILFGVLGIIAIGNYFIFYEQVQRNRFDATIINISGRQRLLLEQNALLIQSLMFAKTAQERANIKKELIDTIQLMESSHNALIHGDLSLDLPGILYPEIKSLYFDSLLPVDTQVKNYINAVKTVLNLPSDQVDVDNPHVNYIQTTIAEKKLLSTLNSIVEAYKRISDENITKLNYLALGVLIFTFLILTLAIWFLIVPTINKLRLEEKFEDYAKELEISQNRFSGILSIAEDAIISVDRNENIILFNQGAETIFGYQHDEIIGKPLNTLIPKQFREAHHHHMKGFGKGQVVARRMGNRSEITALHKSGREFLAEASISHLKLENETIFTVMLRDITERIKIEKELRDTMQKANQANQAKTQFLANMSHEIRTPLNSIVGFSQILLNRSNSLSVPDDFKEYLENIMLSGKNLSELINNILDLSKIEAGKMGASEEALNLKLLVQGIYHINKAQALQKGILFTYDYASNLPTMIHSDRTKLNQIVMNLVSNAIKFTPKGKEVQLSVKRQKNLVVFQVMDHGIGIAKEHLAQIFDMFHQIDSSTVREFEGSGLGLAITKRMVELLGGRIEVESELNQGSVFTVSVPLTEASVEEESTDLSLHHFHFSKDNRILIVEDNPMNQTMMKALFSDLGLKIEIASDGKTAVEKTIKLQKFGQLPDLILMDIHMPGMDGLETTQQIRKSPECQDIPIVALSAYAFTQQEKAAHNVGIVDYLFKPLDVQKLMPILVKYLRQESGTPQSAALRLKPLPESIKDNLKQEFIVLSKIPPFLSNDVIQQVQKMRQLCNGYESPYEPVFAKIENAVYSRNSKQIPALIEEIVDV